jgi:hypothetical protein
MLVLSYMKRVKRYLSKSKPTQILTLNMGGHESTVARMPTVARMHTVASKSTVAHESEDEELCSICFEGYTESESCKLVGCAHKYHLNCITIWSRTSATCPECRHEIFLVGDHIHGIYPSCTTSR